MAKGYTTLFRELGTPEGDFNATFTTCWTGSRRGMNALLDACPDDAALRSFVTDFHGRRLALWEVWKDSLSAELRQIVSSLHDAHCTPELKGGPLVPFETFALSYQAWDLFTRDGLRRATRAHGADPEVAKCVERIQRFLDVLEDAYAEFNPGKRGVH